jgi:hypothetical protein
MKIFVGGVGIGGFIFSGADFGQTKRKNYLQKPKKRCLKIWKFPTYTK